MHVKALAVNCVIFFSLAVTAHAETSDNCVEMSEMAFHVASLRDAGVPRSAVEARLQRDVSDPRELGLGLVVVSMVYKTQGTAEQLKREILKKCDLKGRKKSR